MEDRRAALSRQSSLRLHAGFMTLPPVLLLELQSLCCSPSTTKMHSILSLFHYVSVSRKAVTAFLILRTCFGQSTSSECRSAYCDCRLLTPCSSLLQHLQCNANMHRLQRKCGCNYGEQHFLALWRSCDWVSLNS